MRRVAAPVSAVALLLVLGAGRAPSVPWLAVVATGVQRPLQLAIDGGTLIVLSPGPGGDAAGEIHRMELGTEGPVDLSRRPRVRIPFTDARLATLGSLVVHGPSRALFLGEENGERIWRLTGDERLTLYATGLHRLAGGSALAFDPGGRLVVVDHVDPRLSPGSDRPPPGLEQFRDEDYRGPLIFRLALDPDIPLPRHVARLVPWFPRGWASRTDGPLLPRLVAVAAGPDDDLLVLTSSGDLFRIGPEGRLRPHARLPRGQYVRINMVAAADGTLFVSGGFWVASLFRVAPDGAVTTLATNLADPQGIAVDARGDVYLAESSLHRIVRVR